MCSASVISSPHCSTGSSMTVPVSNATPPSLSRAVPPRPRGDTSGGQAYDYLRYQRTIHSTTVNWDLPPRVLFYLRPRQPFARVDASHTPLRCVIPVSCVSISGKPSPDPKILKNRTTPTQACFWPGGISQPKIVLVEIIGEPTGPKPTAADIFLSALALDQSDHSSLGTKTRPAFGSLFTCPSTVASVRLASVAR